MQILIKTHQLKLEVTFWISQLAFEYGTKYCYTNLNLLVYQKAFLGFLNDRHQRVVLSGQLSDWEPILAGFPQCSILGPLPFPIFINDLPNNLNSLIKLFADDISLFSTAYDPNHSAKVLNDDLNKISEWAYKWKMLFNPDLTKTSSRSNFLKKKY